MLPAPGPRTRGAVTWGLGDFFAAWFAGFLASLVAFGFMEGDTLSILQAAVVLVVQEAATVAWLTGVSWRKGRRSLGLDFGLTAAPAEGWFRLGRWVALGVAVQIAVALPLRLLQDVYGEDANQAVVDTLRKGSGSGVVLFAVGAGIAAPFAEELLFRGVLLRSLLRRMSPVAAVSVTALVFAAIHPLTDPSVGSLIAFPALLVVGLVCGYEAVRSGRLWRSVAVHVGFNLLTVVSVLAVVR